MNGHSERVVVAARSVGAGRDGISAMSLIARDRFVPHLDDIVLTT